MCWCFKSWVVPPSPLHWVYYCRTPLCLTVQTLLMASMCPRGPIVLLNHLERYLLLQSQLLFTCTFTSSSSHSSEPADRHHARACIDSARMRLYVSLISYVTYSYLFYVFLNSKAWELWIQLNYCRRFCTDWDPWGESLISWVLVIFTNISKTSRFKLKWAVKREGVISSDGGVCCVYCAE